MTTGERIREKRIESGMSMDELAERMGYRSRTSIYKIEHNITDLPLSKVAEFAKILNTTSAYNLRHEYGTECARRGLDVRVTMRLMGHSSIKMTAEVYTNLEDSDVLSSVSTLRHARSGVHPDNSSDQDVHPPVHPKPREVGNA